jgi:hypothetical protein
LFGEQKPIVEPALPALPACLHDCDGGLADWFLLWCYLLCCALLVFDCFASLWFALIGFAFFICYSCNDCEGLFAQIN